MRPDVVREAIGRWPSILSALGVDEQFLRDKHGPCPCCGGRDRYRFDDKGGKGSWICSKCGAGSGWDLLMRVKGIEFREAADMVRGVIGTAQPVAVKPERTGSQIREQLRRMWKESERVGYSDPVWNYLNGRGVLSAGLPDALRTHRSLPYYSDDGKLVGKFPAMLAAVVDTEGKGKSIHRTYLAPDGSGKADVPAPKKLAARVGNGAVIRLYRPTHKLALTEGIETALAVRKRSGLPVWATISANGMKSFVCPQGVTHIEIWADNDASFTGQEAAFALAKRLTAEGKNVVMWIPEEVDTDWADGL